MLSGVLLVLSLASAALAAGPTVVPTTAGPVKGVSDAKGRYWKGIPYATPPTGQRRWQNPMPPQMWEQPRDASAFGAG